jgi:hypothetical protein
MSARDRLAEDKLDRWEVRCATWLAENIRAIVYWGATVLLFGNLLELVRSGRWVW